jgi:hypothetical protein
MKPGEERHDRVHASGDALGRRQEPTIYRRMLLVSCSTHARSSLTFQDKNLRSKESRHSR